MNRAVGVACSEAEVLYVTAPLKFTPSLLKSMMTLVQRTTPPESALSL
jgi:hypothetical protein